MALKGDSFSNISDICGVIELLKGVSLQGFQRAFEDLYKQSQHCVKLGGNYIKSLPQKLLSIFICVFIINAGSSLNGHNVYVIRPHTLSCLLNSNWCSVKQCIS